MKSRAESDVHNTEVSCPSCGASIKLDPTSRQRKLQCPRCLETVLRKDFKPRSAPRKPTGASGTQGESRVDRVIRALPAKQAAKKSPAQPARSPPPAPPPAEAPPRTVVTATDSVDARIAALVEEKDVLSRKLHQARQALVECADLGHRLEALAQSLDTLGVKYLEAVERIRELESGRA